MKKFIIFIFGLLFFNSQSQADCNYHGNTKNIGMTLKPRILADSTLPIGSVLYAETAGVSDMRTFSQCDTTSGDPDRYRVSVASQALVAGVTGIQGGPVYETGIDGIGFQISDAISGTPARPVVAEAGTFPLTVASTPGVKQVTVWLIKTKEHIDTSKLTGSTFDVQYAAGLSSRVATFSSSAMLLRVSLGIGPVTYRTTSCNLTLRGGNPVKLSSIEAKDLKSLVQGKSTGKGKDIILDMSCPSDSQGKSYYYWFNPISGSSPSIDGVLPNSLSPAGGGAKDVGIMIKRGVTPVVFYDYDDYLISNAKATQEIKINADYYRLSSDIAPGEVRALLEVVLQEK